ncbi:MAG: IS66 family insertion sequence element accessory protein TnpA [Acidithiobacillus sp.]
MDAGDTGKTEKAERWVALIHRQAESGLRVAAFCRTEGLTVSQFYWWRKRLGMAASSGTGLTCRCRWSCAGIWAAAGSCRFGAADVMA